jgi:hypothetical protein
MTKQIEVGQRISYRVYDVSYSLNVDDSVGTSERIVHGTVTSVCGWVVKVRNDASGRVVNVLAHRAVR